MKKVSCFCIFVCLLFCFVIQPFNSFSQTPGVSAPGGSFTISLPTKGTSETPEIGEWTRSAGPDESLVLTGHNLSRFSGSEEGKDTRFTVYGAGGIKKEAKIQRLDGNKAIITLDKDLPSWSMYLLFPGNDAGYGNPVAINKTEAWWIGPDKTTRGSISSVYGRNLSHNNDTLSSNVYIKSSNGTGKWTSVKKANPYKVDFVIPSDLPNGDYEVWVHNGHGGDLGWSGPLKMTINDGITWNGSTINVKNYGARGDGVTDDLEAIKKGIAAAKALPGATLYFPAGTYMISGMLQPSSNNRWKGDGKDQTIIKCNSAFSSPYGVLFGPAQNFELRDLTFDGNKNYRGGVWHPIYLRDCNNLSLVNVRLSFQNYNVLDLANSRYVFITNSELIGKMTFLGSCSQLFIDGSSFKITNDTDMAMQQGGGSEVSITNSTCQDFDGSDPNNVAGVGKGRFLTGTGNWGANHNTYLGNNITKDLSPSTASADQNSGEQFMWEGNWTNYMGSPASSTNTTTALPGFSLKADMTRFVVIIKGKGLGQSRKITSYNGNNISVDQPWNVIPDQSSVLVVGQYVNKVVAYGNYLDGKVRVATTPNHVAAAGIEPYGGILNFIAANNTLHELRQGTSNWALQEGTGIAPIILPCSQTINISIAVGQCIMHPMSEIITALLFWVLFTAIVW